MKNIYFFSEKNGMDDGSLEWHLGLSLSTLSRLCFFMLKKGKIALQRTQCSLALVEKGFLKVVMK